MKNAIVYWSGTGNTESMAELLFSACKEKDGEVKLYQVSDFSSDLYDQYDRVAFGCPAMGDESLEEDEFQPLWDSVKEKLQGKEIALFGSYSWNSGEWMETWKSEAISLGATLIADPIIANEAPDDECTEKLKTLADKFMS